ncbi:flagellin N-terminal helical domain-containing protein [Deferrisoma palaeochoriense]
MSLSINNNITSLNAWRNLKQTDMRMSKTMEKLSSGLRINRAADDPAGLVISEKMRAQLVGLDAAVKNSEKAINMIQTAEAALDQVQKLLDKMRQLAIDTANLGVNDDAMRQANQDELSEAIDSITRIANYTQFGTKKLLDGSNALTAQVTDNAGTDVDVVKSTLEGGSYKLNVAVDTAGTTTGTFTNTGAAVVDAAQTAEDLSEGSHTLTVSGEFEKFASSNEAGGATVSNITPADGTNAYSDGTYSTIYFRTQDNGGGGTKLQYSTDNSTWNDVTGAGAITSGDTINFTDVSGTKLQFDLAFDGGNDETFQIDITASTAQASLDSGTAVSFYSGSTLTSVNLTSGDAGGGTTAFDLSGVSFNGTSKSDTFSVTKTVYTGTLSKADGSDAGASVNFKANDTNVLFTAGAEGELGTLTVNFGSTVAAGDITLSTDDSNGLLFQVGANENQTIKVGIQSVKAADLGKGAYYTNADGVKTRVTAFASVVELKTKLVLKDGSADDIAQAVGVIDKALEEVSNIRGTLGAVQADNLQVQLDSLRVSYENLQAAESTIRDTDMTLEMAQFTKYQIMMQAGTAMLAQANQIPNNILQLLR